GTGLSGLALSEDRDGFPPPYRDVMYVANPITRQVQALKIHRDGPHYRFEKLADFVNCSDPWFRPVAIHFGPDSCLYIVDWYNKIISHNEVPRDHPDRDKTRGRIWRVRHTDQPRRELVDFTKTPDAALLGYLGANSLWQSHTAWQQIIDRRTDSLTPRLMVIVSAKDRTPAARIQALYALEGLQKVLPEALDPLLKDSNRNIRREAVRVYAKIDLSPRQLLSAISPLATDPDPDVRAEVIHAVSPLVEKHQEALRLLVSMANEPLEHPLARNTQNGKPMKVREGYDRDFERYLIRAILEKYPEQVAAFLASNEGQLLPVENRLLAALALEPKASASQVAQLLPKLKRPPGEEELLRLAQFLDQAGVGDALKAVLQNPATRTSAAEALLRGRTRLDTARLTPLMSEAALALFKADASGRELALRLISGFQLKSLEPRLVESLKSELAGTLALPKEEQIALLRALREIGSAQTDLFGKLATESSDAAIRAEAVSALASAPTADAAPKLFALWSRLNYPQRHAALDRLASSKNGAEAILTAASAGDFPKSDLDTAILDKLLLLLGDNSQLHTLLEKLGAAVRPVLRLDGKAGSYVESKITLDGPFTVETWIRLDPGIGNDDGILGRPGGADFNFYAGHFRVYGGPSQGDRIIAKRAMTPELWTHLAVTRDDMGAFRIYIDG
ncbi:MAG TPA: HEAT repeat domain-containing protein, partial [Verrucomicrobiae bacterium]|nr:HEAT repeat domain-containing protein [Verrucomicrobiae bacterium]